MVSVFTSGSSGSDVRILTRDHCEPHVHVVHEAEGWEAKVQFSYLDSVTVVTEIKGKALRRAKSALPAVQDEIRQNLIECRRLWWEVHGTTCLENKKLVAKSGTRTIAPRKPEGTKGASQVRSALFDPATGATKITFADGGCETVGEDHGH